MLSWLKRDGVAAGAIFGLVLLVYWPLLRGEFFWDDFLMVDKNPLLTGRLGIGSVWFHTSFPLSTVAFWVQYLAWGKNAAAFHLVNIAVHGFDALLIWRLLARLKVQGAWLGAVLFAVHPVCVATVGWISELKNTLSLLFFLLSFLWYLRLEEWKEQAASDPKAYSGAGWRGWPATCYALSLVAFVMSLLSKTSTVVLPVLLLGYAWWRRGSLRRTDWVRTAPYFVLSLAFGLITVWMQQREAIKGVTVQSEDLWGRLAGAGWAAWFYLGKALAPLNLNLIYPRWEIDARALWSYLPVVLLGGVLGLSWRFRRGLGRHIFFGLGCYIVALLPVLGFVDMYYLAISRVSDHFQYLALIAVAALVGAGLSSALGDSSGSVQGWVPYLNLGRKSARSDASESRPGTTARASWVVWLRRAAMILAVAAVAGLSVLTLRRAQVFSTEEGLWRDTLARNPAAWPAHNNLGCILAARQQYVPAREHFDAALRLYPGNAGAMVNLGQLLAAQGKPMEALAYFAAALKRNPQNVDALRHYAAALASQGRAREALPHLREAVALAPEVDARLEYAVVLKHAGDLRRAVDQLRLVLSVRPNLPEALNNLAWILATGADPAVRNGPQAVALAQRACRLTQYRAGMMLGTLAAAYAEAGRFTDAVATGERLERLATEAGDQRLAALNHQLLALYREGRPYHEK